MPAGSIALSGTDLLRPPRTFPPRTLTRLTSLPSRSFPAPSS